MNVILNEKEEENYLKVNLINEFIKYTLFQVHFCLTKK